MGLTTWSYPSATIIGSGSLVTGGPKVLTEFISSGYQVSQSHTHHDGYPPYQSGGPWLLVQTERVADLATVMKKNAAGTAILYEGGACTRHFGSPSVAPPVISDDSLDAAGATAMSRVLPTNPNSEMLNALAEVARDGIPSSIGVPTWKERTNIARGAGSEYLNVEFGWKPLLSDMRKFRDSAVRTDEILKEFTSRSGKAIHRRYDYPATSSTRVEAGSGYGYPSDASLVWTGTTTYRRTTNKWFEGAFMYHVPASSESLFGASRMAAQANHLYGLRVTPDVVWNAAPWSWATDWFTNTGDIMKNVSALGSDGLTLLYGYMMQSEVLETRTTAVSETVNGKKYSSILYTVQSSKQRRPANPYGFGATGLATSSRQKAVVAAIAATRSGNRAR